MFRRLMGFAYNIIPPSDTKISWRPRSLRGFMILTFFSLYMLAAADEVNNAHMILRNRLPAHREWFPV